jgi:excinuclease ABC subunit A
LIDEAVAVDKGTAFGANGDGLLPLMTFVRYPKMADWVIDLGPEGGDRRGEVVAAGTSERIAKVKYSATGQALQRVLR